MVYSLVALLAAYAQGRSTQSVFGGTPPVTLLKPLCGAEPETYECLRSFCDQAYPEFQIIFGIFDPHDPVVAIAQRLQSEFPLRDVQIIIDARQHGSNRKVSNLINMMPHATHDYLVLSDSDVRVGRDYIAEVVAPLLQPDVGIVTCPYRGVARSGLWSLMESLFINEWFIPSVQVAAMAGSRSFAFGASIGIKRDVLARIGGFMSIVDQLADDYRLGELTRALGLRTVLSDVMVEIAIAERGFRELVGHELRWLCTIRALRPLGYSFCFVTFTIPVALLATSLSRGAQTAVSMLAVAVAARILLHFKTLPAKVAASYLLAVPCRDILSLILWGLGFLTRRVRWGDVHFQMRRDGCVESVVRITP
jgi:ceramide glucosyltransferase